MRNFPISVLAVSGLFLLHALAATSHAGEAKDWFAYKFREKETNAFRISLETQSEQGVEAVTGTFVVWSKPWDSDFAVLSVKGQFHPKPGATPVMFRPGFVPLSSMLGYSYMPPSAREVIMDSHGKIARTTGDAALPIPLGT